ncbi:gamma-glutamylcyclotransferase family protein [Rubritalea tangerina]|uniref:Gamma-glutamylcyclotransferase family protein n=1 Tax=Rubritalea tangerina TaxID=430798 RepID=A0ABW4Z8W4_9BACT
MTYHIFVYGTLRREASNAHRMASASFVSTAIAHGNLYCVDWYPGLVLSNSGRAVIGEVYTVDENTLAQLDAYEGEEYRRVLSAVELEDGSVAEVWVWEYVREVSSLTLIASGDWLDV